MTTEITIGKLAKSAGVNVQTLRYYERRRILSPAVRKSSGYRLYDREAIRRLRFIKNAQSLGFTLKEISDLLSLRVSSTARCRDVKRRAKAKLNEVYAKIQDLESLAEALRALVLACRAGEPTEKCPILKSIEKKRSAAISVKMKKGGNQNVPI